MRNSEVGAKPVPQHRSLVNPASGPEPQATIESVQFLRFVAATLVVYSHSIIAINLYRIAPVSTLTLYFGTFGASGVHIFFVISGFIMVYTSFAESKSDFSAARFLVRRFIRIYPIYWIYAGLYLLVHQSELEPYQGLSVLNVIASLLLLPGYSPLIIGPGWTLSYEVYFYLCFGLFMRSGLLRGLSLLTLFFIVLIFAGRELNLSKANALSIATDSLLLEFLFGAWIGYFFVSKVRLSPHVTNLFLALAFTIFVGGIVFGYHRLPSAIAWGVPSGLLVLGSVFGERAGTLPKLIRGFSFLGDSSYSLYLLHVLLIDIVFSAYVALFPGGKASAILLCIVMTIICIAVAHLSYKLVESRLVGALKIITTKRVS